MAWIKRTTAIDKITSKWFANEVLMEYNGFAPEGGTKDLSYEDALSQIVYPFVLQLIAEEAIYRLVDSLYGKMNKYNVMTLREHYNTKEEDDVVAHLPLLSIDDLNTMEQTTISAYYTSEYVSFDEWFNSSNELHTADRIYLFTGLNYDRGDYHRPLKMVMAGKIYCAEKIGFDQYKVVETHYCDQLLTILEDICNTELHSAVTVKFIASEKPLSEEKKQYLSKKYWTDRLKWKNNR